MKKITVNVEVKAPIEKVWEYWNNPKHIVHWAFASDNWCCPGARNDVKVGGVFVIDMEDINPESVQAQGWQAILNNFKKYIES